MTAAAAQACLQHAGMAGWAAVAAVAGSAVAAAGAMMAAACKEWRLRGAAIAFSMLILVAADCGWLMNINQTAYDYCMAAKPRYFVHSENAWGWQYQ